MRPTDFRRRQRDRIELIDLLADVTLPEGDADHGRLHGGPYKVEITQRCMVKQYSCEVGEIVALDEEGALCLAGLGRGKIAARPLEKETIKERITQVVDEMLRGASL